MNNKIKLIISILIPVLIWAISWFATSNSINDWYILLEKPIFNPPNWIFWPVWTTLYIMIGISFYLVWKKWFWKYKNKTKIIYTIQLILNFLWSFSFFYFENIWLWLINIILLWIVIIINIYYFYIIDKKAWIILIPYLLWVSFASILNISLYLLN